MNGDRNRMQCCHFTSKYTKAYNFERVDFTFQSCPLYSNFECIFVSKSVRASSDVDTNGITEIPATTKLIEYSFNKDKQKKHL